MANLPHDHLDTLPLDDPLAFAVLNDGRWSGIFQFNGMALQSITKQFSVDKFDDIVSVTALGRPGPLASGVDRFESWADQLRAALAARGLKIVESE